MMVGKLFYSLDYNYNHQGIQVYSIQLVSSLLQNLTFPQL